VCGRFDVARPGDPAPSPSRPVGDVQLIEQDLAPDTFIASFSDALQGKPLAVAGVEIAEHGMNSAWSVVQRTRDWFGWGPRGHA